MADERLRCRRRQRKHRQHLPSPRDLGYNLVVLAVLVTVMNVLVAAALPVWSQAAQRQQEAELIFRGLQYAEAIRVFQQRHGRYPVRLEELLEVEPRSIRQLWKDPFRDDGRWGVVTAQAPARGPQVGAQGDAGIQQQGRNLGRDGDDGEDSQTPSQDVGDDRRSAANLSRKGVQAAGPITGVRSLVKREAIRTFLGGSQINDWTFTADLIPALPAATLGDNVPRMTSDYIGRPFPEGLSPQQPQQGTAPNDPLAGNRQDGRRNNQGNRPGNQQNRPSQQNMSGQSRPRDG